MSTENPTHVGAESLDEVDRRRAPCPRWPARRRRSSTRSPWMDGIAVDLDAVGAVFEVVLLVVDVVGQLARLADRDETGAEASRRSAPRR